MGRPVMVRWQVRCVVGSGRAPSPAGEIIPTRNSFGPIGSRALVLPPADPNLICLSPTAQSHPNSRVVAAHAIIRCPLTSTTDVGHPRSSIRCSGQRRHTLRFTTAVNSMGRSSEMARQWGEGWLLGGGVRLAGDLCAIQLCFERFGGGSCCAGRCFRSGRSA